jgi:hypothetical protein
MKNVRVAAMFVALAALATGGLAGCKRGGGDDPPGWATAKETLSAFTKPGADYAALSTALRPKSEDYDAVFVGDAAQKVRATLDPIWDGGKAVLKPLADQTEIVGAGVTPDQLGKGEGDASACPDGYKDVADKINPKMVVYCARFVKPGEKGGLRINGLVYVNGHWALFQNSFKALK